ncbi:hypothetical protein FRB94_005310 [Tulasnella sp. JGI-2019a]|nr:hypothetical protein FRB93_000505 [Tulasnella sp. JGI-2019a]KAG9000657.1 hypothetical protein FRB94_005310 [Tulasnella sp. JGI-2019a]
MFTDLPPELFVKLLSFLAIQDIASVILLSKAARILVDSNESQVYRSAAIFHGFLTDGALSLEEAKGYEAGSQRWLHEVHSWKAYCRQHMALQRNWNGDDSRLSGVSEPLEVKGFNGYGSVFSSAHRFKIDEVENTLIYTSEHGGLYVVSVEDGVPLWSLPEQHVRPYAHVEYDKGYIIFDAFGPMEIWRRSTDQLNTQTTMPCTPRPSQLSVVPVIRSRYLHTAGEGQPHLPRRGAYVPFTMLQSPGHCRASRFVHPYMLAASTSQGGVAFIWHVPTSTLVQTINIPPLNNALLEWGGDENFDEDDIDPDDFESINYVELSDECVFVCWRNNLVAYSRRPSDSGTLGQVVFTLSLSARMGDPDFTGRRFPYMSFRMPHHALSNTSMRSTRIVTCQTLPEVGRMHVMDHEEFCASHVSPDGRDLVAVTRDGWLFYAPDFLHFGTSRPTSYGPFRINFPGHLHYLAFDGKRILIAMTGGIFFISLENLVYPGATFRGKSPAVRRVMCFQPGNSPMDASCAQLTNTAIWLTYSRGPEFMPTNVVTQVDFTHNVSTNNASVHLRSGVSYATVAARNHI